MLLPQLRHSPREIPHARDEAQRKQARSSRPVRLAVVRNTATAVDSERLVSKGQTLLDESPESALQLKVQTVATLLRALDKAETTAERLAILAELKAWREER